jgi:hypothetical protein
MRASEERGYSLSSTSATPARLSRNWVSRGTGRPFVDTVVSGSLYDDRTVDDLNEVDTPVVVHHEVVDLFIEFTEVLEVGLF